MAGSVMLALAVVAPAQAQFSESYKFLEAVKKKDGNKVTEMLGKPGTTVINTRDSTTGRTGLHIVTEMRDLTWMSFLLAKGANPNAHDSRGVTPLEVAVGQAFDEGVQLLLSKGARVDEADTTGTTPLISAVLRRDGRLVKMLLAAGANPDRPDNSGRSARDYAKADAGNPAASAIAESKVKPVTSGKSYGPHL